VAFPTSVALWLAPAGTNITSPALNTLGLPAAHRDVERPLKLSCSFVGVILPPLQESGGDQLVQQTFTQGSLQTEKTARLWQGER
jgi:hypothetical protein